MSIPVGLVLNLTIEERVGILETQVVEIEEDIADLDQDVNFLFDETVIQDERLFSLEQASIEINEEVEGKKVDLEIINKVGMIRMSYLGAM